MVLQGIMASDDEEVEAWYLEGWCFFLMAEQTREQGEKLDELTWEESHGIVWRLVKQRVRSIRSCNFAISLHAF